MRLKLEIAIMLLLLASGSAGAIDAVACIYARKTGPSELVYRVDGRSFKESELGPYFRKNKDRWPLGKQELRLVFDGDVPLSWFHNARRQFSFLGFGTVRCYSGSFDSPMATEIKEVGPAIALPEERW